MRDTNLFEEEVSSLGDGDDHGRQDDGHNGDRMMKIVKNEKAKTRVKTKHNTQQHEESRSDESKLGLNKLFKLII